uniref:Matrilin 2 n=1 Tax=Amphiprion percula TaxID=161767 RepID=A0A3P8SF84_AMPPE
MSSFWKFHSSLLSPCRPVLCLIHPNSSQISSMFLLTENSCKAIPLDFVFVIDSSRSIRPNDYEKVKTFIINLLQFLEVGSDATRIGLLQYGSVVQPEFSLNTYTTKAEVEQAVRNMKHLASGTMTGLAIQYTMETAFTEEQGARPKSLHIPRIAMIVTDGRPQDTVEEIAAETREAGIQIFAIGVGRVDMNTLKTIGSEPHLEHVYLVANFSQIETLISVFQSKLCGEIDYCDLGNHGCEHNCVSVPDCVCKCRKGYTLRPDGKTCKNMDHCADGKHGCEQEFMSTEDSCVCKCRAGFTLQPDGKTCQKRLQHRWTKVQPTELVKQFVNGIVDSLNISRMGTHVGLLQYSTKVRTEFTLNQYSTVRDIKQAVTRMQYMGRGSMTGSALRHMYEFSFSAKEGARPNTPRVSIVFTDGRSQDDVSEWATKAKNSGTHIISVTIYTLGVGKAIEQELREIASEPDEKHLYYAEDFEKMGEITKKLKSRICTGTLHEAKIHCQTMTKQGLKNTKLEMSDIAMSKRLETLENQLVHK